jgi:4-hydroxybutyrate dehydrogenase
MALIVYNTRIHLEFGAIGLLARELSAAGIENPLVITDQGIARMPLLQLLKDNLAAPPTVYDEAPANPTEAAVEAAAAIFIDSGCDGIIGFGGGSAMDLAKAVAVRATNPPPLEAFAYHVMGAVFSGAAPSPLVLIPTTAGTGSEVSRGAVIHFRSGRKALLFLPPGSTRAAILDPELTLGLPPGLTAATGLDAIAHCVETFCSPAINPPADAIALDGLGRLLGNIERAVADGSDRHARTEMMTGAMEGALAFQKGMGAVHALSHPLGTLGLHHGTLNAVLMPHVLTYNSACLEEKFMRLRRHLRWPDGEDVPRFFAGLNRRLGMPASLEAMGVARGDLPRVAAEAMHDSSHPTNPRPMAEADYLCVLEAAFRP